MEALAPILEIYVRLEKVLTNQAHKRVLGEIIEHVYHCISEVTTKPEESFILAPCRWVVERKLSWLDKARYLYRDYEMLPENYVCLRIHSYSILTPLKVVALGLAAIGADLIC